MSEITRVTTARIVCEYGGVHDEALAVIWAVEGGLGLSLQSDGEGTEYEVAHNVDALAYRVSYYLSAKHKAEGFRTRPLKFIDGEGFSSALSVTIDQSRVDEIMAGPGNYVEKVLNVIEYDLKHRF